MIRGLSNVNAIKCYQKSGENVKHNLLRQSFLFVKTGHESLTNDWRGKESLSFTSLSNDLSPRSDVALIYRIEYWPFFRYWHSFYDKNEKWFVDSRKKISNRDTSE